MTAIIETPPCSWIEFGNLAIGLGTFALAIVLGVLGWHNSRRDRKVHIADKQQEWLREFRHNIAELMALQLAMSVPPTYGSRIGDDQLGPEIKLNRTLKLDHLTNKVLFMFDTRDGHYDEVKIAIEACTGLLGSVTGMTAAHMGNRHSDLRILIDRIIHRQRNRIANLDTQSPLI